MFKIKTPDNTGRQFCLKCLCLAADFSMFNMQLPDFLVCALSILLYNF